MTTIKKPVVDWVIDEDGVPYLRDASDMDRFLDECVDALTEALDIGGYLDARQEIASMLEAAAKKLQPKRGRPQGATTSAKKWLSKTVYTKRHLRRKAAAARTKKADDPIEDI